MMNRRVNDGWMTALIEASSDAIISYTPDGEILTWNRGAEMMFGYGAREVIGQLLSFLAPSDLQAEQKQILQTIQNGKTIIQLETVRVRKGGERFPVSKTISPVRGEDGQVSGAVAIIQDITERKYVEQRLRAIEERQRFLLMLSDALRPLSDPVEIEGTVTHTAMQYFGADRCYYCTIENGTAIIQRDAARDHLPSVVGIYPLHSFPIIQAAVNAGHPFMVHDVTTTDLVDEDLRRLCIQLQVISFVNIPIMKHGTSAGVLCLVQHIPRNWTQLEVELAEETAERTWAAVEHARTEAALRASEARARTLVTNLPGAAAFIFDRNLRYVLADGEALYTVGRTPADYEGKLIDEVVSPDMIAFMKPPLLRALDGVAFEDENMEDGITFLSRGVPLYDDHGSVTGVLVVSYDISERKQAEVIRERAYVVEQNAHAEAEAALKTRDQFLSIASHELRTPLTSLLGYASMLQSTIVSNPSLASSMSERIIRQAQRLNGLVGQLLDISRLQRGQFVVTPHPLDMTGVVAQVIDAMRVLASTATHPLVFTHPNEPVMIMGDAERLEQVVQNLISNAIKYTPMGGAIHVLVRMIANDALIEVTDHGIGIPEAARVQLFQPFYRATNVGTQASGFGLGLHIVQQIIERHGGRIEVESVEGDGSTFRVLLPLLST